MTSTDYGSLAYLFLLGSVLAFWLFVQNRDDWSKKLQQSMAWGLIFVGVIAAFGLWGDIRSAAVPTQAVFADTGRIHLPRAPDGHFYVTVEVNDTPVRFVVDTGATGVVLTRDDAERAGLRNRELAFYGEANTANGMVRTAPVTLRTLALGPVVDTNIRAYVNAGEMQQSLLGMDYLQRFEKIEITKGGMVLVR